MPQHKTRDPFPRLAAVRTVVLSTRSYLRTTGWMESMRRGFPCDPSGNPLPWMNYAAIALLNERLRSDMSVFEYGSGDSTLYFAPRVRTVTSVEHSAEWRDSLMGELPENATVMFRELDSDGAYCRAIHDENDPYDVVVVDGRDRVNSLEQSIDRLSPGGVILLDDSNRPRYAAAYDHARDAGFRALRLQGLKPRGKVMDESTLFYRDGNCFGI